jgi:hypothetical protein
LAEHLRTELEQITTFEEDTPSHDAAISTKVAHDSQSHSRFAAARLSHEANTLPLLQGQRDVNDGRDVALTSVIADTQVVEGQDRT